MNFPEKFRFQGPPPYVSKAGDPYGMFLIPGHNAKGRTLKIIASDGLPDSTPTPDLDGWEHVSVSLNGRREIPSWEEMCLVKDLFWHESECVCQFHPPRAVYVNRNPYVLHLWRNIKQPFPTPPSILV
jgi:hypothetical protein